MPDQAAATNGQLSRRGLLKAGGAGLALGMAAAGVAASPRVEVRADDGALLAHGDGLPRTAERPMTFLHRDGRGITREDRWPTDGDIGLPVILAGGEIGVLRSWWQAADEQQ